MKEQSLTLALSLVRPSPLFGNNAQKLLEETEITDQKYGSVRKRWMIENNPVDEVNLINGSDHVVMFSKPLEFFSCLQEIAEKCI
ncbi:Alpha/Beta hydrolase fold containing protein [Parasponia andersonii]|uniref:Alpha/Beta hydrolase fold containing protein n=1 Tax=Parasponia andersonii TaxID=3476 RepID=A0A2P5BZ40_PARAD|nr:Alpha/Beta hydrolase fold containing protein [Parasponia andersonii]